MGSCPHGLQCLPLVMLPWALAVHLHTFPDFPKCPFVSHTHWWSSKSWFRVVYMQFQELLRNWGKQNMMSKNISKMKDQGNWDTWNLSMPSNLRYGFIRKRTAGSLFQPCQQRANFLPMEFPYRSSVYCCVNSALHNSRGCSLCCYLCEWCQMVPPGMQFSILSWDCAGHNLCGDMLRPWLILYMWLSPNKEATLCCN